MPITSFLCPFEKEHSQHFDLSLQAEQMRSLSRVRERYSKTLSIALVIGTPSAQAILLNAREFSILNWGVYAIGIITSFWTQKKGNPPSWKIALFLNEKHPSLGRRMRYVEFRISNYFLGIRLYATVIIGNKCNVL